MMRNMGSAVGSAVSAAIIYDQTNAHFNTIAANLSPTNGPMLRTLHDLSARYAVLPGGGQIADQAALHRLWTLAYREASTLAYADAFRAVMLAFIVATLLVPLMRKVAAPKTAAPTGH